jgi:hypothetical protein
VIEASIRRFVMPEPGIMSPAATEFHQGYKEVSAQVAPDLVVKDKPNLGDGRPEGARTISFDVEQTLPTWDFLPTATFFHQCWDKAAPNPKGQGPVARMVPPRRNSAQGRQGRPCQYAHVRPPGQGQPRPGPRHPAHGEYRAGSSTYGQRRDYLLPQTILNSPATIRDHLVQRSPPTLKNCEKPAVGPPNPPCRDRSRES